MKCDCPIDPPFTWNARRVRIFLGKIKRADAIYSRFLETAQAAETVQSPINVLWRVARENGHWNHTVRALIAKAS